MRFTTPKRCTSGCATPPGAGGDVGEAARTLARPMHLQFDEEDQVALRPSGPRAGMAA